MRTRFWAGATAVFTISAFPLSAEAQHQPHHPAQQDTTTHADSAMAMEMLMSGDSMSPGVLGIPLTRMGSGTSWLPDASPMHAVHFKAGSWALMVLGVVFGMYDKQFDR